MRHDGYAADARVVGSRWASRAPKRSLFDHTAGNASSAAAQWLRLVAVIVAADVDHHRFAVQYPHILDMRRGQGLRRAAVPRHLQDRQVAEMAASLRSFMLAGMLGVEMTSGTAGRHRLAVGGGRLAGPVLMDVETVRSGRQPFQRGLDDCPARPVADRHDAQRVASRMSAGSPGWQQGPS